MSDHPQVQDTDAVQVPLTTRERRALAAQDAVKAIKPSRFTLADEDAFWAPIEDADGNIVGESAVCVTGSGKVLYAVYRPANGREVAIPLVAAIALVDAEQV